MADWRELGAGIFCIDTHQHRAELAACFLVEGGEGRCAIVESGTGHSVADVLEVLAARGHAPESVDFVMPTHVHLDHAGGAGALIRALPNARLVIHPRGARHMVNPSQLIAGAEAVYGKELLQALYGEIVPVPEERVLVAEVAPGQDFTVEVGGRRLLCVETPGHARHHYAVWDEATRGWFSGDVFGLSYREFDHAGRNYIIPTTSPVQFDPEAWEGSLERILSVDPAHIYLTHYGRVDAVTSLAAELRTGLAAYQKIALALADEPERHERLREALMQHHLGELRERQHPMPEAKVREILAIDTEINAQGLGIWLNRLKTARAPAG